MKIPGIIFGIFWVIPILIVGYWWISLPLYYAILALEFLSIRRVERDTRRTKGLFRILITQATLPLSPVLLYPIMPGRKTHTHEPFNMDKFYFAICAGIILAIIGFIIFWILKRLALKKRN